MMMNLMYLWPTHRRDFLDEVLSQSFPNYTKILSEYKKVLHNRNKVLKNISEWKSEISELSFWSDKYIESAETLYKYRNGIRKFLEENIQELSEYFFWKVQDISFRYITKTDLDNTWEYLRTYIKENQSKEILLRKTLRWPHLDDFDIIVNDTPLTHFASRWEVKSILLWLKFLETKFLEKYCPEKEILFLIDDFLSELDSSHRDLLWKHIWSRQSVISSINDFPVEWNKIFI
jgi:DNA replication and repair protein RecF